jgi:AraC family transcriptional regulator, dual regulator of chb operon
VSATKAFEPDELIEWREVAEVDVSLPYWIHRAGHSQWSGSRTLRHTHVGFAEIFWVESGKAVHEVNGFEHTVRAGDLVFVDRDDVHRFRTSSMEFAFVNLAVPDRFVASLVDRYVHPRRSPWQLAVPRVVHLAVHDWARVLEIGNALGDGHQSRRRVDHFLLELLMMLDGPVPSGEPMPDWLVEAVRAWRDEPVAMQEGVSGIARLAARSREHVSRSIKKATGNRAVDLVNRLRIEHSAAMLRMSDVSITQIAADSGLPNLSHFYEVFKQRYGTTPRQYRLSHRRATNPVLEREMAT